MKKILSGLLMATFVLAIFVSGTKASNAQAVTSYVYSATSSKQTIILEKGKDYRGIDLSVYTNNPSAKKVSITPNCVKTRLDPKINNINDGGLKCGVTKVGTLTNIGYTSSSYTPYPPQAYFETADSSSYIDFVISFLDGSNKVIYTKTHRETPMSLDKVVALSGWTAGFGYLTVGKTYYLGEDVSFGVLVAGTERYSFGFTKVNNGGQLNESLGAETVLGSGQGSKNFPIKIPSNLAPGRYKSFVKFTDSRYSWVPTIYSNTWIEVSSSAIPTKITLSIKKTGTGSGRAVSVMNGAQVPGIDCGEDCSEQYSYSREGNIPVTIGVIPDSGSFINVDGFLRRNIQADKDREFNVGIIKYPTNQSEASYYGTLPMYETVLNSVYARDLKLYDYHEGVMFLRTFLEMKGFLTQDRKKVYLGDPTLSQPGPLSFDSKMVTALKAYQTSKGITPVNGIFGPMTRAAVIADSLALAGGTITVTTPEETTSATSTVATTTPNTNTGSTTGPTICTADAMMCSDGTFVGRTGPNCEFVCSTTPVATSTTPATTTNTTNLVLSSPISGTYKVGSVLEFVWKYPGITQQALWSTVPAGQSPVYTYGLKDSNGVETIFERGANSAGYTYKSRIPATVAPGTYTPFVRPNWGSSVTVYGQNITIVSATEPIICTADAMMCSNGTSVGRTGPNCQFVCPTTPVATSTRLADYYKLTVIKNGEGLVTGNATYYKKTNRKALLLANPAVGYKLANWEGCSYVLRNMCIVNMTSDKTVTANFVLKTAAPAASDVTTTVSLRDNIISVSAVLEAIRQILADM